MQRETTTRRAARLRLRDLSQSEHQRSIRSTPSTRSGQIFLNIGDRAQATGTGRQRRQGEEATWRMRAKSPYTSGTEPTSMEWTSRTRRSDPHSSRQSQPKLALRFRQRAKRMKNASFSARVYVARCSASVLCCSTLQAARASVQVAKTTQWGERKRMEVLHCRLIIGLAGIDFLGFAGIGSWTEFLVPSDSRGIVSGLGTAAGLRADYCSWSTSDPRMCPARGADTPVSAPSRMSCLTRRGVSGWALVLWTCAVPVTRRAGQASRAGGLRGLPSRG